MSNNQELPTRTLRYLEGLKKLRIIFEARNNDGINFNNLCYSDERAAYSTNYKYVVACNNIEEVNILEMILKNPENYYKIFPDYNYHWQNLVSNCEQLEEIKNPIKLDFKGFSYTFMIREDIYAKDNFIDKYYPDLEGPKLEYPLVMSDLTETAIADYINDENDMFNSELNIIKRAIYVFEVIENDNDFDKKYILMPGFNPRDIDNTIFVCGTNELPKLDYEPINALQLYFNYDKVRLNDNNFIAYNFLNNKNDPPLLYAYPNMNCNYFSVSTITTGNRFLKSYISEPTIENYRSINYIKTAIKR